MRIFVIWAVVPMLLAWPGVASAEEATYGCSYPGQRGNVLVLVSRSSASYVKMQTQRIPASYRRDGDVQTWSWSGNAIVLGADGTAKYYQGSGRSEAAGTFRCKPMG